jgi:hypothetical protein
VKRIAIHPVLSGLAANVLGSTVGAFFLAIAAFSGSVESVGQVLGGTAAVAFYGFVIALPFVYLYGMPIYAALKTFGAANIGTGILVGALPGIAWVLWTHGSWIDPVLWNGTLIAAFYVCLRRWCGTPSNNTVERDGPKAARLSP